MYIDDMGADFDFENMIKEISSCVDFTDYDENSFDYIDDFQRGGFENSMEFAEFEFENDNISY